MTNLEIATTSRGRAFVHGLCLTAALVAAAGCRNVPAERAAAAERAPSDSGRAEAGASMPQQIADAMTQLNGGVHTGFRFAHAKGLVLTGTFQPAKGATSISRAAHLRGGPVPVTVRLSDGTGVPQINDDNPNASPRGMAIRFALPGGAS